MIKKGWMLWSEFIWQHWSGEALLILQIETCGYRELLMRVQEGKTRSNMAESREWEARTVEDMI